MAKRKQKRARLKRLILSAALVTLLSLGGWVGILASGHYLVSEAQLDHLQQMALSQNSSYVRTDEMPEYVWEGFLAIEDHRFKQHGGIDWIGLVRALWVNGLEGSKAQGGSTITMQLSRNLFLTHEKELSRKIKEMIIAVRLERQFSKEQILELYLNHIYFGHGKYGIEAAANFYFGKTVRADDSEKETVTLSEAALLAALPKAPEHYSPLKDLEQALHRRNLVLSRMVDVGFITEDTSKTAMHQAINIIASNAPETE